MAAVGKPFGAMGAAEIHAGLAAKEFSAAEVTANALDRIRR